MKEFIRQLYSLLLFLVFLAALGGIVALPAMMGVPVQAAPVAPPEVKECQKVNTAKVSDVLTIIVFRCEPENGPPYLLNTVGFMKDEE